MTSTIILDTFTRPNGDIGTAETGQTWLCETATGLLDSAGDPAVSVVSSNRATQRTLPSVRASHDYVRVGINDYTIDADLTSPEDGVDGVLFRLANLGPTYSDDLYYWWTGNFIWQKVAGSGAGQFRTVYNGATPYAWPAVPSSLHITIQCVGRQVYLRAGGVSLTTDIPDPGGASFLLPLGAEGGDGVGLVFRAFSNPAGTYQVDNLTVTGNLPIAAPLDGGNFRYPTRWPQIADILIR